jgi:hypothetical protein
MAYILNVHQNHKQKHWVRWCLSLLLPHGDIIQSVLQGETLQKKTIT